MPGVVARGDGVETSDDEEDDDVDDELPLTDIADDEQSESSEALRRRVSKPNARSLISRVNMKNGGLVSNSSISLLVTGMADGHDSPSVDVRQKLSGTTKFLASLLGTNINWNALSSSAYRRQRMRRWYVPCAMLMRKCAISTLIVPDMQD